MFDANKFVCLYDNCMTDGTWWNKVMSTIDVSDS